MNRKIEREVGEEVNHRFEKLSEMLEKKFMLRITIIPEDVTLEPLIDMCNQY